MVREGRQQILSISIHNCSRNIHQDTFRPPSELDIPEEHFSSGVIIRITVIAASRIRVIVIWSSDLYDSPIVVNELICIIFGVHKIAYHTGNLRGMIITILQHTHFRQVLFLKGLLV